MKKVVVIFSGGMDSTTLVYDLMQDYEVYLLSFDYGQRHIKELNWAAPSIANKLNLSKDQWRICNLQSLHPLIKGSSLTSPDIKVPDGPATEETMRANVVPNRNAIMLSIAWGYATSISAAGVAVGIHAGSFFPDAQRPFIEALQKAFVLGTNYSNCERIFAPYIKWYKRDIVTLGKTLNVPYELTWSCYKEGKDHCGFCGACIARREAFRLADVYDPTTYVK